MAAIIKVYGLVATGELEPDPTYVRSVDHSKPPAESVVFTSLLEEAQRFSDAAAALEAWQGVNQVEPVRDDGKPNRPLTAYSVEIAAVDE